MTDTSRGSTITGKTSHNLAHLRTLLIDLDGTVFRGEALLPGAKEFFAFLGANHYKFVLLTNNSTSTPRQYRQKLRRMGIDVDESYIFTSGVAVAGYLQRKAPKSARVYVIGEAGLREAVLGAGFRLDDVSPDYVVVGLDREFNYQKLTVACRAIRNGAKLVGANSDMTWPIEDGFLPGAGALLSAVATCAGARPLVVGKPNTHLLSLAIERLGAKRQETAIVGDRIDTDVLAGKRARIETVLLLTGVTEPAELDRSRIKPGYVFRDLRHFQAALEQSLTRL